jgi:hypothetical protein
MLTPEVQTAIEEIRTTFPESVTETTEDGNGGAYVVIRTLPLSTIYIQRETWMGFHIVHAYPYADVYPHFVRCDLARVDRKALGEGLSLGTFQAAPAIQISRRSNRHNPATDTALLKVHKVLRWLNSRP